MRLALAVVGVVSTSFVMGMRPADAQYGRGGVLWNYYNLPWCLTAAELNDCSYANLQQCNVAASGTGGTCYPNPRYSYQPKPPRPNGKKKRSQSQG